MAAVLSEPAGRCHSKKRIVFHGSRRCTDGGCIQEISKKIFPCLFECLVVPVSESGFIQLTRRWRNVGWPRRFHASRPHIEPRRNRRKTGLHPVQTRRPAACWRVHALNARSPIRCRVRIQFAPRNPVCSSRLLLDPGLLSPIPAWIETDSQRRRRTRPNRPRPPSNAMEGSGTA